MDILYLSHCVPNPPDKGEKIRAFHEIQQLATRCRIHLACFATSEREETDARALSQCCASVHVGRIGRRASLAKAALSFAAGASLAASYYRTRRFAAYVADLASSKPIGAVLAYSAVMAPFAPAGRPLVVDFVDFDSEKWLQYGEMRTPGWLYRLEGMRLRKLEGEIARAARSCFFTTENEAAMFRACFPDARTAVVENGVDFAYFDPAAVAVPDGLRNRRFVLFLGAMDYFPNADAVCRFASELFPPLRRRMPDLEFFIVGRNPARSVRDLGRQPGVTVTGAVEDTRPYLKAAQALVVPLQLARGIQNKVLEALAMDKPVLASPAVCRTLGAKLPEGVARCETAEEYASALSELPSSTRDPAARRFAWAANLGPLVAELERR